MYTVNYVLVYVFIYFYLCVLHTYIELCILNCIVEYRNQNYLIEIIFLIFNIVCTYSFNSTEYCIGYVYENREEKNKMPSVPKKKKTLWKMIHEKVTYTAHISREPYFFFSVLFAYHMTSFFIFVALKP